MRRPQRGDQPGETAPLNAFGTPGTTTVSAEARSSSPCRAVSANPPTASSAVPGRSAHTFSPYQGAASRPPSSGRASPNTSTTTPSSNGAMPAKAYTATWCTGSGRGPITTGTGPGPVPTGPSTCCSVMRTPC